MLPHAINFYLKIPKTAKTRSSHDTTLQLNDSKQLFPVLEQVLDKSDVGIQENVQKPDFFVKMGKNGKIGHFGQNLKNGNFFQKSLWNIFYTHKM